MYFLTDTERPNVTCSADQVVETDAGRAFATVILPPVAYISDNDGIASVQIKFNGSIYDATNSVTLRLRHSVYMLVYNAQDAAGNEDWCASLIEVVGECFCIDFLF